MAKLLQEFPHFDYNCDHKCTHSSKNLQQEKTFTSSLNTSRKSRSLCKNLCYIVAQTLCNWVFLILLMFSYVHFLTFFYGKMQWAGQACQTCGPLQSYLWPAQRIHVCGPHHNVNVAHVALRGPSVCHAWPRIFINLFDVSYVCA